MIKSGPNLRNAWNANSFIRPIMIIKKTYFMSIKATNLSMTWKKLLTLSI